MKLKIIVADDEKLICTMLAQFIKTEELQLEIIHTSYDGEDLYNHILELRPDIVITDINMPKMDGLDVIKRITERGLRCKFIIISGFRQFEYAYNALKYDVVDYLLKPVDQEELNTALSKISWQLRHGEKDFLGSDEQAVHEHFINRASKLLLTQPRSLNEINATYRTHFRKGYFQELLIRLDNIGRPRDIPERDNSLHKKVQSLIKQYLGEFCHEIITANDWDDIFGVLNFSEENREVLHRKMTDLFFTVKDVVEKFGGVTATLCLGGIYSDVCQLEKSRLESTEAAWMRLSLGVGRTIFYDRIPNEHQISLDSTIGEFERRIRKSFEILSKEEFARVIGDLFALPKAQLSRGEVKSLVRKIPEIFFEQNEAVLSQIKNSDHLAKELRYSLRMATSYCSCREILISRVSSLIDEARSVTESKNTRPVRLAIDYVKKNYGGVISLDDVSSAVGLSSVYFSTMFKRETGQNFSDFVTGHRLEIAKNHLKNSNMNIQEIATSLGFSDSRYFSKIFKKKVGIRPTEYRQIYS